jgi:hypothetical protein
MDVLTDNPAAFYAAHPDQLWHICALRTKSPEAAVVPRPENTNSDGSVMTNKYTRTAAKCAFVTSIVLVVLVFTLGMVFDTLGALFRLVGVDLKEEALKNQHVLGFWGVLAVYFTGAIAGYLALHKPRPLGALLIVDGLIALVFGGPLAFIFGLIVIVCGGVCVLKTRP